MKTKHVDFDFWAKQYDAALRDAQRRSDAFITPERKFKQALEHAARFKLGSRVRVRGTEGVVTALPCTHPEGATGMPHGLCVIRTHNGEFSVPLSEVQLIENELQLIANRGRNQSE